MLLGLLDRLIKYLAESLGIKVGEVLLPLIFMENYLVVQKKKLIIGIVL
jgi:hypothetical protein